MIRTIRTYFPFAKATVKSEYFAYRSRFLLWAIANCVSFVAQLFLWKAIYENSPDAIIKGYSFSEMILYLGISKIVECMSFASIENKVSKGVRDGEIANSLIKPIKYKTELLFRSLGQIVGSTCLFLPMYLLTFFLFSKLNGVTFELKLGNVLIAIVFLALAFMLNYYISLISSAVIFRTVKHSGIYQLKKTLVSFLAGALFPIAFYPTVLQKAVNFMPFIYLRYYPTIVMQGKVTAIESLQILVIGVLWVVVLGVVASALWKKMIKKLMVFGG